MSGKKYVINSKRWQGVYGYDSENRKVRGKIDVCYYINYRFDGKLVWEKIGWKSEGLSPEVAAELRADRVRSKRHGHQVKTSKEIRTDARRTNKTIGEIKSAYFDSETGSNLKGRVTDLNRYDKHLKELFEDKRVGSLCVLDIERLKKSMCNHAPATIANTLELLRRIINYGVRSKSCPHLSFTIELPKKDNQVTEYLTPEQASRLMGVLDSWPTQEAPRMLKIAWLTGMRRGEIFKLEERDCDFIQKIITIRDPKGGKTETIPMSSPVAELLLTQINAKSNSKTESIAHSPFVFPGKKGMQRTDSSAVNRIKIQAALPESFRIFHGLRHHLAVTLASSGNFTLDMIGSLLTHKSYAMTARYAKFLPDAKKKAADQAAEILVNQLTEGNQQNKIIKLVKN